MKFTLLNIEGNKKDTIEVSDKIVKLKVNYKLIKFVIDWQLNHLKPRTAKTKQRNEIKGSTKKIVAQKGSGGARHASKKAPLFVGGGVAHGPKGLNYKVKKINKKVRKLALAQSLSKKNIDKNLHILADVKKEIKKTKEFDQFLKKNNLGNVLIISDTDTLKNINKSTKFVAGKVNRPARRSTQSLKHRILKKVTIDLSGSALSHCIKKLEWFAKKFFALAVNYYSENAQDTFSWG